MSDQLDLSRGLELRYATGDMVGIVLTPKTVQDLTAERDRLRDEVGQLRKQLDESRRQVALLEQDWQSMFRLLPRELQVTEEDMREALQTSIPFEKLIQELEQRQALEAAQRDQCDKPVIVNEHDQFLQAREEL